MSNLAGDDARREVTRGVFHCLRADSPGLIARYRATPVGAWAARVWNLHRHQERN